MADITMCQNENCKIKEKCFRYTALVSENQSYIHLDKEVKNTLECDYFWNNGKPQTISELRKQVSIKTAPGHGLVDLYKRGQ